MNPESYLEAKIVLLGDSGVGKTSLVMRYVHQQFSGAVNPTIGASFLTKTIWIGGTRIKIQLWDTAGQERFRSLAPMYYRGAAAALLVFDVTSDSSFYQVKEWVKELRNNVVDDIVLVLVANQIDKKDRKITTEDAKSYADSIGAILCETSAKANIGIEDMFVETAKRLLDLRNSGSPSLSKNSNSVAVTQQTTGKKCCLSS